MDFGMKRAEKSRKTAKNGEKNVKTALNLRGAGQYRVLKE